jgi:hypothetical protein
LQDIPKTDPATSPGFLRLVPKRRQGWTDFLLSVLLSVPEKKCKKIPNQINIKAP